MIHPSYVELMKVVNEDTALVGEEPVVNSRYSIVSATAKRARQIVSGDDPYIDHAENMKPLSIAVKELYDGSLKILGEDEEIPVGNTVNIEGPFEELEESDPAFTQ